MITAVPILCIYFQIFSLHVGCFPIRIILYVLSYILLFSFVFIMSLLIYVILSIILPLQQNIMYANYSILWLHHHFLKLSLVT